MSKDADPVVVTGQGDFKQEWPPSESEGVNVDNAPAKKPAPAAGFYPGVKEAEYRAWDAMNFSNLKHIRVSPAHLKEHIDTPPEPPSDEMRLGSAVHCLVLTPELFDDDFAVMPKVDRRTKDGKALWAEFVKKSTGKTIIDAEQYVTAQACARSVLTHPVASGLLANCADREAAVVWTDPDTGILCKGKIDGLNREAGTLIDLKTAANASPAEFQRVIANREYHTQAGMYGAGLEAVGHPVSESYLIAVETKAPFPCVVYRLTPETAEIGRMEASRLLRVYGICMKANKWPGYSDHAVVDISIPIWKMKQYEEDPPNYDEPGWDEAEEGGGL